MPRLLHCFLILLIVTAKSYGQTSSHEALQRLHQQSVQSYQEKARRIQRYLNSNLSLKKPSIKDGRLLVDVLPSGIPVFKAPLNAGASITTGAARLQNQLVGLNLEGENMTVGVWDDGIVKTHIELGNRILTKEGVSEQTHCTHVTGTILAAGVNAAAKGMAPKAFATTWDYDNDEAEMISLARPDQTGLLFSNHSYGTIAGWFKVNGNWAWAGDPGVSNDEDYRFGYYSDVAKSLDQIAWLAPYYTIMWAAGNDRAETGNGAHPPDGNGGTGYDCIIPESVSKNLITVGAVNKVLSYTDASSVVLSNFSSTGPTDDGRIKPDIVAAGVNLFSLSAVGTDQYTTLSGTSMATPNATGSLVLVQELYSKLHGGNFMRSSTLKGLAIHTTKEAGNFPGPDYQFGWGLLDVEAAANVLLHEDNVNNFVRELTLQNGEAYSMSLQPQANQKITITICWTDPAGTPVKAALDPTDLMLVNDLDVRITDSTGTTISPWILDPFNPSNKATTGDNFRDNVEKIEFTNPEAKKYYVNVTHKGQLTGGHQDFAIIITSTSGLSNANTYYWIGNDGNWSDGAHWSLTSGGAAASAVPSVNDNIVFDENSFDNTMQHVVSLSTDVSVKKIIWINDKTAGIALNAHTLKVSDDFSLAGKNFQISTAGTLQFESLGSSMLSVHSGDLSNASLLFSGGNWKVSGDFTAKDLSVTEGDVTWTGTNSSLSSLSVADNVSFNINGSTISGLTQSSINAFASLQSAGATLGVQGNANFQWNNITFDGKIILTDASSLSISGSNTIHEIDASPDAQLNLKNGLTQNVDQLTINSSASDHVKIQSDGKATIHFTIHQKFCFDYLEVQNVDVTGNAVVSAGVNSTITNSTNWIQQNCSNVMFADFDASHLCSNSRTVFTDKSSGNMTSWSWDFGDVDASDNTSTIENATHSYSTPGSFQVKLTVSDGTSNNTYTKQILIQDNTLSTNTVVLSGNGLLLSFLQASTYQWYKDGAVIDGAVSRSYNFNGVPGEYTVVLSNGGDCNVTASYVITAVENEVQGINIYPIPANDVVKIQMGSEDHVKGTLRNSLGQSIVEFAFNDKDFEFTVNHLPEGLYVLTLQQHGGTTLQKKIVINHK